MKDGEIDYCTSVRELRDRAAAIKRELYRKTTQISWRH
jgi:hypothetical protein